MNSFLRAVLKRPVVGQATALLFGWQLDRPLKKALTGLIVSAILVGVHCSGNQLTGGGSDLPDKKVFGKILTTGNLSAANTQVLLLPENYNSRNDTIALQSLTDTTDEDGNYCFSIKKEGKYNIQALHLFQRTRLFAAGINVITDSTVVPAQTLKIPGTIKVHLPDNLIGADGYLYIPGTTISSSTSENNGWITLDSVPPGFVPTIYYCSSNTAENPRFIADSVEVPSGGVTTVAFAGWKYSGNIRLNTSATGANTTENVYNFPVLVKLTDSNFNFSEAQNNGGDIRFAKSDGSPVAYEIENWDSAGNRAEIWVNADTIYGNTTEQYFTVYWGNPAAVDSSNGAAVFDTGAGFQGVWHLAEAGIATNRDATKNGYHGTPYNTAYVDQATGAIGPARLFDGASSYIRMPGTAGGKLDFPARETYTVSSWVYANTLDQYIHAILGKGDGQYSLENHKTNWAFCEFQSYFGWEVNFATAASKKWTHICGVRSGENQYLFVDGTCVDSSVIFNSDSLEGPYKGHDLTIGALFDYPSDSLKYFFNGMIDEVRILNVKPSWQWIKLCYVNQQKNDNLVVFRKGG